MNGMNLFRKNLQPTIDRLTEDGDQHSIDAIKVTRVGANIMGTVDETVLCPGVFGLDNVFDMNNTCDLTDAKCKECWAQALAKDYDMTPKKSTYDILVEAFDELDPKDMIHFVDYVNDITYDLREELEAEKKEELSQIDKLRKKYCL